MRFTKKDIHPLHLIPTPNPSSTKVKFLDGVPIAEYENYQTPLQLDETIESSSTQLDEHK
jgi:hypothetical protein